MGPSGSENGRFESNTFVDGSANEIGGFASAAPIRNHGGRTSFNHQVVGIHESIDQGVMEEGCPYSRDGADCRLLIRRKLVGAARA